MRAVKTAAVLKLTEFVRKASSKRPALAERRGKILMGLGVMRLAQIRRALAMSNKLVLVVFALAGVSAGGAIGEGKKFKLRPGRCLKAKVRPGVTFPLRPLRCQEMSHSH
jgi:hypothetical protein